MEEGTSEKKPFAAGLNFYKLFWIFFLGCFAGYIAETIWCFITIFHYESRAGVIYGPLNPVYGFGAVLLIVCMYKLMNASDRWVFIISALIGSVFEYFSSLFQELTLSTISWEYSNTQMNFQGRTNLLFAFIWGFVGVIWVKDVYPRISRLIERIPKRAGIIITWALLIFMTFNMGISALAVKRQTERKNNIPATDIVSKFLDQYYTDDFLNKIYPNMTIIIKDKVN